MSADAGKGQNWLTTAPWVSLASRHLLLSHSLTCHWFQSPTTNYKNVKRKISKLNFVSFKLGTVQHDEFLDHPVPSSPRMNHLFVHTVLTTRPSWLSDRLSRPSVPVLKSPSLPLTIAHSTREGTSKQSQKMFSLNEKLNKPFTSDEKENVRVVKMYRTIFCGCSCEEEKKNPCSFSHVSNLQCYGHCVR